MCVIYVVAAVIVLCCCRFVCVREREKLCERERERERDRERGGGGMVERLLYDGAMGRRKPTSWWTL